MRKLKLQMQVTVDGFVAGASASCVADAGGRSRACRHNGDTCADGQEGGGRKKTGVTGCRFGYRPTCTAAHRLRR